MLFLVLIFAVCMTHLASDIYAPSVPFIADALHTKIDWVQLSMAIYMLGVAITQHIYGPISEAFGRKKPMAFGLVVMLVGSIMAYTAQNIYMLLFARLIQGCGAGGCSALWRSVFRDAYSGDDLSRMSSYLTAVVMFIVPAAPAVGGYLQHYFDWRASFLFMVIYTIIALIFFVFGFKETHSAIDKKKLARAFIVMSYRRLLASPIFMGVTMCTFLCYGAVFTTTIILPALWIEQLHISPVTFGWILFLGSGIAYGLAGQLNGMCVKRFGMNVMMRFGFLTMLLSSILLYIMVCFFGMNLYSTGIPLFLMYFGTTFIWPNAFAMAFTPFGEIAGIAGALYGFMQLGGGAIIGGLLSFLPDQSIVPMASTLAICSCIAWLIFENVALKSKEDAH